MNVRKLPEALQQVAKDEINEDPSRIEKDLQHIKEWFQKQPHLNPCTDDQFLLAFLRGTKYSLERTKQKLDMYYTLRTITPEIFMNRRPSSEISQKILNAGILLPLPKLPNLSSTRYVLDRQIIETDKIDPMEYIKVLTMMLDIMIMEDDNAAIAGITGLQDYARASLKMLNYYSPSLLKKFFVAIQEAYPYRIRGIHYFNVPPFLDVILNLFRPFFTKKNRSRMQIYSNLDDLYKVVPLEILPEEYGGQGGKLDDLILYWKEKVLSYEEWFIADEKRKSDESKRIGEPKTEESVYGIQGSFRQLSVD